MIDPGLLKWVVAVAAIAHFFLNLAYVIKYGRDRSTYYLKLIKIVLTLLSWIGCIVAFFLPPSVGMLILLIVIVILFISGCAELIYEI